MGDVYFNGGAPTMLLTLPANFSAFYLYVEGNYFVASDFTMLATNAAAETSLITLNGVQGFGGATGVGFSSTSPITTILITNTDGGAAGFAVGEFGIMIHPSPGALGLFGVAGLLARRRRRA